jgi:ferritin-like protein
MASDSYHEPLELLSEDTRNLHRALVSLMEELEAIDWYQQRAEACPDASLKAVLLHNRNEEIEHAMMVLEWIRRRSGEFDAAMKQYLFTERPIDEIEEQEGSPTNASSATLGIGARKER